MRKHCLWIVLIVVDIVCSSSSSSFVKPPLAFELQGRSQTSITQTTETRSLVTQTTTTTKASHLLLHRTTFLTQKKLSLSQLFQGSICTPRNEKNNHQLSLWSSSDNTEDDGDNQRTIDFQSDTSQFGRGQDHLSAFLEESDVVVYQTGSWEVDGVTVGADGPATFCLAQVDTIQLVWTHNCEHGVIRAFQLEQKKKNDNNNNEKDGILLKWTDEAVEFGPEQLIARLPVTWLTETECRVLAPLDPQWI